MTPVSAMGVIPGLPVELFADPFVAGGRSTQLKPTHQVLGREPPLCPLIGTLEIALNQAADVAGTLHSQLRGSCVCLRQKFRRNSYGEHFRNT